MNLSDSNQIANFYEQMLLQRNLVVQQQLQHHHQQQQQHQNESLHLQILNKSGSSTSSASSTSSLLSISSKSQQASPNNSLVSDKSESPDSKPKPNEYETNYQAYMMNAAAAAAAAGFPYNLFNNFNSSTPIMTPNVPKTFPQQPQQNFFPNPAPNPPTKPQTHHHHHYHHSNQNIYRPNGKSEEAKPTHSYIGLIALAILSTPEKKLVLSDIYQWILDNYTYFHTRGSGWRNSIRHNLSLNDCFMKSGRSANGKGHYWTIHPANMEDFVKGDFRRRRAQRRVRKSLGLTVPEEDEEDDDILTPPSSLSPIQQKFNLPSNGTNSAVIVNNNQLFYDKSKFNFYNFQSNFCAIKRNHPDEEKECASKKLKNYENENISEIESISEGVSETEEIDIVNSNSSFNEKETKVNTKKRSFNVDSLLAPDGEIAPKKSKAEYDEPDELNSSTESSSKRSLVDENEPKQSKLKTNNHKNFKTSDDLNTNSPFSKLESNNEDVEKWKQTFSKIMARSYKNNTQISQSNNHSIGGLIKK